MKDYYDIYCDLLAVAKDAREAGYKALSDKIERVITEGETPWRSCQHCGQDESAHEPETTLCPCDWGFDDTQGFAPKEKQNEM